MAIGIRIKFPGMTQEIFDQVNAKVDPDSDPPEGLLFHASGPIDGGWGVIDFWESREHYDRFGEARIRPAVGSVEGAGDVRPDVNEFPVHEHYPR